MQDTTGMMHGMAANEIQYALRGLELSILVRDKDGWSYRGISRSCQEMEHNWYKVISSLLREKWFGGVLGYVEQKSEFVSLLSGSLFTVCMLLWTGRSLGILILSTFLGEVKLARFSDLK